MRKIVFFLDFHLVLKTVFVCIKELCLEASSIFYAVSFCYNFMANNLPEKMLNFTSLFVSTTSFEMNCATLGFFSQFQLCHYKTERVKFSIMINHSRYKLHSKNVLKNVSLLRKPFFT